MRHLDEHLEILRGILRKKQPLSFKRLVREAEETARHRGIRTSRFYVARLILAATANTEATSIVFPDIPKILLVGPSGNYGLVD